MARKSQGTSCCQRDLIMMIMILREIFKRYINAIQCLNLNCSSSRFEGRKSTMSLFFLFVCLFCFLLVCCFFLGGGLFFGLFFVFFLGGVSFLRCIV